MAVWLQLPPDQRPHFITLYFSNVDHAGHNYGPDSEEVRAAVHHLDDMIGELQTRLAALHRPIDLAVLTDHGMVTLKPVNVNLSDYADLSHFHTEGSQLYAMTEADAAAAYEQFRAHPDPRFTAYRRADVPAALRFNPNPREGDPVIVPSGPYTVRAHASVAGAETRLGILHGGHGFAPQTMPEMKAIFFAEGPDIRRGVTVPLFDNVNVYPFLAGILGLTPGTIDGSVSVLQPALANSTLSCTQPSDTSSQLRHIGGSVTAPVLIYRRSPEVHRGGEEAEDQRQRTV